MSPRNAPKPAPKYKYAIKRAGGEPLTTSSNKSSLYIASTPATAPVTQKTAPKFGKEASEKKPQPAAPQFAFSALMSKIEKKPDIKTTPSPNSSSSSSSSSTKRAPVLPITKTKEAAAKIIKRNPVFGANKIKTIGTDKRNINDGSRNNSDTTTPAVATTTTAVTTTNAAKAKKSVTNDNPPTTTAKEVPVKTLMRGTNKRSRGPEYVVIPDSPPPSKKMCTQPESPICKASIPRLNIKPMKPLPKPTNPLRMTIGTKVTPPTPSPPTKPQPTVAPAPNTASFKIPKKEVTQNCQGTTWGPLATRFGTSVRDEMGPKWAIAPKGQVESQYWDYVQNVRPS